MWQSVMLLMDSGIEAAGVWLLLFLACLPGAAAALLSAFFVYTVVRLLIAPLVGSAFRGFAGSDFSKPRHGDSGSSVKRLEK